MTLIAISAAYGAQGSRIAPKLAERFGVPFLDRAIPVAVAERLEVPVDEVEAHDENSSSGGLLESILRGFLGGDPVAPAPLPPETFISEDFHRATREVLLERAAAGEAVILGRGSALALREDPRALRVRLHGPFERRVRQAMRIQRLDEQTAERAAKRLDRAHAEYARRFYGVELDDPGLYHLMVDSTALDLDACVELIAVAAVSLEQLSPGVPFDA